MSHTPSGETREARMLSREELLRASRDENTILYEPHYDVQFEPWPVERVLRCVQKLAALTAASGSTSAARAAAMREAECREFAQTHGTFYARFTEIDFVRDKHKVNTAMRVLDARRQLEAGQLTHEQAHGLVSQLVLQAGHTAAASDAAADDDDDDRTPRVSVS